MLCNELRVYRWLGHGWAHSLPLDRACAAKRRRIRCLQGAAMFKQFEIIKSTLLSLALVVGATPALTAQERLFEWSGRVDGETRIMMRGDDVWTQDVRGRGNRRGGARISRALPSRAGQVRVLVLVG